ncbi:MAG: hypothetical protein KGY41_10555, partial [Desulfovermiculus sp.]|nr:hypothetical protein [Desulfovermiculus sp.]
RESSQGRVPRFSFGAHYREAEPAGAPTRNSSFRIGLFQYDFGTRHHQDTAFSMGRGRSMEEGNVRE